MTNDDAVLGDDRLRLLDVLLEEEALKPNQVSFKFADEYWNDELRTYRFSLKSRCIEETAR